LPSPLIKPAVRISRIRILEADLEPNAYGYRPKKSAQDAIQEVVPVEEKDEKGE